MNEELVRLIEGLSQEGLALGLVFLRVGPVVALMPGFGESAIPMRVKLALALAMTLIVGPAAPTAWPADRAAIASVFLAETVNGLALGIGLRSFVFALQIAGTIAAQATSLSQILGNAGAEPMPAMGQTLTMAGLCLAVMAGLHVEVAVYLLGSYDYLPFAQYPAGTDLLDWGSALLARSFSLAFTLGAVFLIISTLYNLTLGVINRAMPQLMVAFVGAPAITFGGVALLYLFAVTAITVWHEALRGFLAAPFGG